MCAHVTVAPDDSKMTVFSKGTSNGGIAATPVGGQHLPASTLGLSDAWKKAQKNARKKNTSETINKIIPIRNPASTWEECFPWNVASRATSRHHCTIVATTSNKPSNTRHLSNLCIQEAAPLTRIRAPTEPVNGHGLQSTM